MKKKVILMWSLFAAMTFGACTEKEAPNNEVENVEFAIELDFAGAQTRAASNAVPVTSWDIIEKIQFFLYDKTTKVVKFSAVETNPGAGTAFETTKRRYVYTSVPAGTYKLVAVASTNTKNLANITPFGATDNAVWDKNNVLAKNISALFMTHKKALYDHDTDPATADVDQWPTFMAGSSYTVAANGMKPYQEPAEIFLGTATGLDASNNPVYDVDVVVDGNVMNNATVTLKREVSLMRVRIDANGVDNHAINDDVHFAGNAAATASAILIRHLPEKMNIGAGTDGGVNSVANATTLTAVQVITEAGTSANGMATFKTANPGTGDGYGATNLTIVDTEFKLWRDIIVFPNSDRAAEAAIAALPVQPADKDIAIGNRKYLIAISGFAEAGHILADGTEVTTGGKPVYWIGVINEKFLPNQIREVNISLNTGGYLDLPTTEFGDLTIVVNEPTPWDSNIATSTVEM
ncbi:FimB/Mfa2 family fimbrial subunit [Bacteroides sp. UBA939]|uniref:FimB/Mfa2 family fimbrial subunit n=1 Tax=Bacteroides sp. UBA939 TaxID=1946092 RepID=UPI0025C0581A|nr:FimB/Mfa2 family fimbrial subunit [Bacteroides sp. UBA939]